MITPEELLERVLNAVRETGCEPRQSGDWHNFRCPAHEDKEPSCGARCGDEGIVFKCHSGCHPKDISQALGFHPREMFYKHYEERRTPSQKAKDGISVAELAANKRLPARLLFEAGCRDEEVRPPKGKPCPGVVIPYHNPDGSEYTRARARSHLIAKKGSFWLGKREDGELIPYGLGRPANRPACFIVEGESDCWTLWHYGLDAIGLAGATQQSSLRLEHVQAWPSVYIVRETDTAGGEFAEKTAHRLIELGYDGRILVLTMRGAKDPNDLHQAAQSGFVQAWRALAAEAKDVTTSKGEDILAALSREGTEWEALTVAERYLEAITPPPAPPTGEASDEVPPRAMAYHNALTYEYTGKAYRHIPDSMLDAKIMRHIQQTGTGKPGTQFAKNVRANLGGLTMIPYHLDAPFWISAERPAKNLVCLQNGILDIDKTASGQAAMLPHSSDLFTTIQLPFAYNQDAVAPRWNAFLLQMLPEQDQRDLLQEWIGYCMTSSQKYQKILCMVGQGANGKSVIVDVIRNLIGPENCSAQPLEAIHEAHNTTPLVGKLVNFSNELGKLRPEGEGVLKAITGGDPVQVNPKNKDAFQTVLQCRMVITSNNMPHVSDKSDGIWRRLIFLPFMVQIAEADQKDKDALVGELCEELPGILNWALQGLARLQARGRFTEPVESKEFKEEQKKASNPAREFFDEYIEIDFGQFSSKPEAYTAYKKWAEEQGLGYPLAQKTFGRELRHWLQSCAMLQMAAGDDTLYKLLRDPEHTPKDPIRTIGKKRQRVYMHIVLRQPCDWCGAMVKDRNITYDENGDAYVCDECYTGKPAQSA